MVCRTLEASFPLLPSHHDLPDGAKNHRQTFHCAFVRMGFDSLKMQILSAEVVLNWQGDFNNRDQFSQFGAQGCFLPVQCE